MLRRQLGSPVRAQEAIRPDEHVQAFLLADEREVGGGRVEGEGAADAEDAVPAPMKESFQRRAWFPTVKATRA